MQMLGGTALSAAGLLGYTRLLEPNWIDVERRTLTIPGLSPQVAGTHIAQISDIHLSQYTSVDKLFSAVDQINALKPDLVLLTGDFVGDEATDAQGLVEPLRRFDAPAYAVFGNHDLWTDRQTVGRYLSESGVKILVNQAVQIQESLYLAGIDDVWSGRPDLSAALRAVPTNSTTLLMAHEPDFFDQVIDTDAPVAVQFSGHSHGGQVRIPMIENNRLRVTAPVLPRYGRRYAMGLRRINNQQVYTNRGLGVWPLPYRFNCRPEITLFQLEAQT
jgi:predicted MPP superfamily phosphohydrolase